MRLSLAADRAGQAGWVRARGHEEFGGTDIKRRAGDKAETVRERLKALHAQTAPLIARVEGKGILERIDAMVPSLTSAGVLSPSRGEMSA